MTLRLDVKEWTLDCSSQDASRLKMDFSLELAKRRFEFMRLTFLSRISPIVLCSLILIGAVPRHTYATDLDLGCPDPSVCTTVPEPDPGLISYAIGFLGIG